MRLFLVAALTIASLPAMAAPLAPAGTKAYEGWTVTCDNLGACVVLGAAESDDLLYLRIARPAGADASPAVKLVLAAQDTPKGGTPAFRLTAVDAGTSTPLGPYPGTSSKDDPNTISATIEDGAKSLAMIDAVRNAATLDVAVLDRKGTFSLKGLSAALRDVDARQGRAGTPTALVAKGMTPIGQVPPPVAPALVEPAAEGSVTAIEKPVLSKALEEAVLKACDPDIVKAHEGLEAWRLGPDKVLTGVPCQGGAYNFTNAFYLTDAKGNAPKPLALPQPPGVPGGEADAANMVVNDSFDLKTMVLTSFAKGRGIADCGSVTDWVWTGSAFALLDASGIDACPGALPEDWPSLYTAKRK